MYKTTIAFFFSFLFLALLSAPTLVLAIDADYDISILLDSSEEEEKEGKESLKDIEIKVLQMSEKQSADFTLRNATSLEFYSNTYSSTHMELFSPPPERRLS